MKILITGIAGFIGSHLAELLQRSGHEVVGLDNFSPYYDPEVKHHTARTLERSGIRVVTADLREPETLQALPDDFDYVFHLAAQSGISVTSTFEDYLSNNIVGTKNLIDVALRNTKLRLFVNISTSSVYGLDASYSEETPPAPISFYGTTKLAAEQLVLARSREGKLPAVSLRLYSVFGPRERPEKLYPKLIHSALTGTPFTLYRGGAQHIRSFTFVDDAVKGIAAVIGRENQLDGEVINIGTTEQNSTQQGIDLVQQIVGEPISIQVIEPRPGDQFRTSAVIDKARRLLDYDPHTSLAQGLRLQVQWYKDQLQEGGQ